MPESCKVYITARKPTGAKAAGSQAEVVTYSDADPLRTLQSVVERQPDTIALDHEFAASPRGLALIERLRDDPVLAGTEIVVVLADGTQRRYGGDLPAAPIPEPPPCEPVDDGAMRRAPRVPMNDKARLVLDGQDAMLLDLSVLGAQVLSAVALGPGRTVRVILPGDDEQVKVQGVVVWARFEMAPGQSSPCYRLGIAFTDPDPVAMLRYCGRHRREDLPGK
jgi:hypothetical protein